MNIDDLKRRLTEADYRRLFQGLGINLAGHRANSDGWINGLRLPNSIHDDTKSSLAVNVKTGAVIDQGGHYKGDLFKLVMDVHRVSFIEAKAWVTDQVGLSSPSSHRKGRDRHREKRGGLERVTVDNAQAWNHALLHGTSKEEVALRNYLTEKRGLLPATIEFAGLGIRRWKGSWWLFLPHEVGETHIERYKMFAFDVKQGQWKRSKGDRKMVVSRGSPGLYTVLLKGLDASKVTIGVIYCEGELDALKAAQEGFFAITETHGANKTTGEIADQIMQHPLARTHPITILYDNDDTGREGALRTARLLRERGADVRIGGIDGYDGRDVSNVLLEEGREALEKIIREAEIYQLDDDRPQVGVLVSEVERETVEWLWEGRIPLGKITLLDGDPGLGKSTLMIDIAARLTRGNPMPSDEPAERETDADA